MPRLRTRSVWRVVAAVGIGSGLAAAGNSIHQSFSASMWVAGCLAGAYMLGEWLPAVRNHGDEEVDCLTFSSGYLLALAVLAPLWACVIVGIFTTGALILFGHGQTMKIRARSYLFNLGQEWLGLLAAQAVLAWLLGAPFPATHSPTPTAIACAAAAGAVFLLVNNLLTTGMYYLSSPETLRTCFKEGLQGLPETAFELVILVSSLALIQTFPLAAPLVLAPQALVFRSAQALNRWQHSRLHDPMTGLPNRELLVQRMHTHAKANKNVGVLVVGLDRVDEVITTLGSAAADAMVLEAAQRISSTVRGGGFMVGRLTRTTFAIITVLEREAEQWRDEVEILAERVLGQVLIDFLVGEVRINLGASAGACLFFGDEDADTALSRAELAQTNPDTTRVKGLAWHDVAHEAGSPDRLALVGDLATAIEKHPEQIHVYFQPKLDASTGIVLGAEALVRWQHPERGLIPPMDFIPLAETTGRVVPLTWVVMEKALRQAEQWRQQRNWGLKVSVNIPAAVVGSEKAAQQVQALLEETGLPAELLILEVTESGLITNPNQAVTTINQLHKNSGSR